MKVSVCMITYNHVEYIAKAIESVMMQKTDFDFELVIGEDCSTDRTREVCLEYKAKYPDKIKLRLPEKNMGAQPNVIANLQACKGEYIAMLEGDDYWIDENKLQKQIDFLSENPDFIISCHSKYNLLPSKKLEIRNEISEDKELTILDLSRSNFISTLSVVYRNNLIEKFPPWFYNSSVGDYPLFMFLAKFGKIKYFSLPMAVYRIHQGGVWSFEDLKTKFEKWITLLDNLLIEDFSEAVKINIKAQKLDVVNEILTHCVQYSLWKQYATVMNTYSLEYNELKDDWLFVKFPNIIDDKKNNPFGVIKTKLKNKLTVIKSNLKLI
ncbi:glycosyltransferase family 2 protein [Rufibacter glacialis]|uniref:Glycosyltransferase n=1 Tax=Rufibacter glacialis TaxID=1259555 RepID=A0A5M8QQQ8_9BACT|nr:glycosyltransferase [Rufibacter glacialis]KAA6437608.1 glycosyltransferase [Rufibacter glacialis]GGK57863.1 hypothetical protein GCM10011405_02430 [Rufibacter glacialis]